MSGPILNPSEQTAFEAFGDAWHRLKVLEQEAPGMAYLRYSATQEAQTTALALKTLIQSQSEATK